MKPIEVNLINYTQDAMETLIYSKSTRLEQCKDTRAKINAMTKEEKTNEIVYMANTVPSSWEMIDYIFEIRNVTRAFTHQLVRTRTGSYAQQAMRIAKMKQFTYCIPSRLKEVGQEDNLEIYKECMRNIQKAYDEMIDHGVVPEDARGVLPTNIHTNIIAKFNLRSLADLVKKRQGFRTQEEYREVVEQMLTAVLTVHPWAEKFLLPPENKNIKYLETFIKNMREKAVINHQEEMDAHKALDKIRGGNT